MSNLVVLTSDENVRAIDAVQGHSVVSSKYKFINTRDIVDKFESRGWTQISYKEAGTRKYKGYQTHVVALTHGDEKLTTVGDSSLRILITNNHHAGKSLTIKFGLYRLACSNGLVVSSAEFEGISLRHMGEDIDGKVNDFIDRIAVAAEKLREKITAYKNWELSLDDMCAFAKKALETRFKAEEITEEMVSSVLKPNRGEDITHDAWTVFNRVQENIIHGFNSPDRERRIRRITSVKKDIEINEQLWQLLAA